jgi:predicted transposase YbfD/YdcC
MTIPTTVRLLDHFAALRDPRQRAKVVYALPEILLLVLSATLAGADDFVETTIWGAEHLAFLKRFYPYESGIPSHDTLRDVFAALDPELFKACFLAWIGDLRDNDPDIIAIDGKTSRRSHDRRKGRNPLHLVSAWAARQRIVLGQQASEEKSNEITAIPLLLKHLDLTGALVMMDAMGTQTDIARAIRDGGGDYCMSLKRNWPAVYADVEQLLNEPPDDVLFETNETVDLSGGRLETRRHTVCHKIDWMTSDRRYPGEPVFLDLAMIGRIETEVEGDGKIEHETRYYLCSLALCALTFARAVRAHRGMENRLHWMLDVIFREHLARFRTGQGPQNMAIIRHTALNLLSRAKPTVSFKNRRKRAGWNVDYLETLIRQNARRSSDSPGFAAAAP